MTAALPGLAPLAALLCMAAPCCCGGSAGGGGAPRTLPADFAVRYEWGNGALPPR